MDAKLSFKEIITAGAIAAGASVIVNSILFFIFHSADVISDTVYVQPNQPLTVVPVIVSSILPTLIGAVVFFLLEKYTNNGFKIFQLVAMVLVVLSFSSPFMAVQGMPIAYGIVLNVMHVVVAYSLVYFIGKAKK